MAKTRMKTWKPSSLTSLPVLTKIHVNSWRNTHEILKTNLLLLLLSSSSSSSSSSSPCYCCYFYYRRCAHFVLLSSDCSGHRPVLGCSDHGNESLGFTKGGKFLYQVSRKSLQHRVSWLVSWLVAWLITALLLLDACSKVIWELLIACEGRDSLVVTGIRYGLDGPWIESRWERDFPLPVQTSAGATQTLV
jgi:hypothetical protein